MRSSMTSHLSWRVGRLKPMNFAAVLMPTSDRRPCVVGYGRALMELQSHVMPTQSAQIRVPSPLPRGVAHTPLAYQTGAHTERAVHPPTALCVDKHRSSWQKASGMWCPGTPPLAV